MDGRDTRKTTETSLSILEMIDDLDGGTLSELSEFTGLATSTLYSHLQTLENAGYVVQDGDRYCLGLKLFHLGEKARHRDERYRLAKQQAADLANKVSEEVNFAVEEHGRSIILFDETPTPADEGFQTARYFHMHSSASGKAMLAEFSDERVHEIIDQWGLPKLTENTITDRDTLFAELETIREQGYATNHQEEIEGLYAVAMPIHNPDGSVFGTLDISGPAYRLPDDETLADQLAPAVSQLESDLELHE